MLASIRRVSLLYDGQQQSLNLVAVKQLPSDIRGNYELLKDGKHVLKKLPFLASAYLTLALEKQS